MSYHRSVRAAWLLFAILCLAFYLRIVSVRFGLPAMNDPDELIFELGALRMLRGHTLNPGWFGHPATTTMYVLALIDAAVAGFAMLTGRTTSVRDFGTLVYADPSWIVLPGRIVMMLFALLTVWLTWSLATRLFGHRAGLAAALLLAVNPVHVTWSQIIRSDMMACAFMLLCLRCAVSIAETGRWRDYRFAALWLGLAIVSKWPFALCALAIGTATVHAVRAGVLQPKDAVLRLVMCGAIAIVTLFLVSPYLLLDHQTVLRNLQGEGQPHHLGANGGSFWYNLLWYLGGPIDAGFGTMGLFLIAFGCTKLSRRHVGLAVLAPTALAFIVLFATQHLVWERWSLPLMPLGAIVAGAGVARLADLLARADQPKWARLVPISVVLAAALPLGARAEADNHARMNDTRQHATQWAWRHIPPGSRVLIEHNAFDMVGSRWSLLFPMGNAGCVDVVALIKGRASYAVIEMARNGRSNVDYGTMAAARRADCRADFAILTNRDRYYAERDVFPQENAAYDALIASGSVVATYRPSPGRVAGPVVTIVDLRAAHSPRRQF